jgi:hypothetical protein
MRDGLERDQCIVGDDLLPLVLGWGRQLRQTAQRFRGRELTDRAPTALAWNIVAPCLRGNAPGARIGGAV